MSNPRARPFILLGGLLALTAPLTILPVVNDTTVPAAYAVTPDCGKKAPANKAGFKTVFVDDFDGKTGQLPDPDKWIYSNGTMYEGGPPQFGTWENQTNTSEPENVSLDGDGCLRITALRNRPVELMDLEDGKFPDTEVKGWTAARIETKRADFKAPEGGVMRVDYRLQAPNVEGKEALGYWPAFWMLPGYIRDHRMEWPKGCELDLFENVQGKHDELWNVVHCKRNVVSPDDKPDNWGGSFNEPTGVANNGQARCEPTACQDAQHDFGFEWDRSGEADELRWYVDGKLTFKFTPTPEQMSDWSTINEHDGFGLIANIAMGGAFPASRGYGGGPFASTQSGGQLVLDYVKVSTKSGSGTEDPEPEPTVTTEAPEPTTEPEPTATTKAPEPSPEPEPTATQPNPTKEPQPTAKPEPTEPGVLEAENADTKQGVETKATYVTAKDGGKLVFKDVELDGADRLKFTYRPATTAVGDGGFIRAKICDQEVNFTTSSGDPGEWRGLPFDLAPISGTCDVTVTFDSGQPRPYADLDKIEIGKSTLLDKAADFIGGLFN